MHIWIPAALLLTIGLACAAGAQTRILNSFEADVDRKILKTNNTVVVPTHEHATEGKQALKVTYSPSEWPSVALTPETPWDWREFTGVAIDITNPGKSAVEFGIRADDDPHGDGNNHSKQGMGSIPAGKTLTVILPYAVDPMHYGMRALPAQASGLSLPSGGQNFDPAHVVTMQVFMHQPAAPTTLILDNVRLVHTNAPLDKIVDRFGQYAKADWPYKLHDEADFAARAKREQADIAAHPAPAERDKYGGWTKGPKLNATGFFRTEKVDGKWWLVTPDGHLFFSMGVDCVGAGPSTVTSGREEMFAWLPNKSDPLAHHVGYDSGILYGPVKKGAVMNFFTANLERKYGKDYDHRWIDTALLRLRSWGFNTIANWSDARLYGNTSVPFVATTGIDGDHARVSSGSDYWGKMHDPFDPKFAADVKTSMQWTIDRVKGNPWCLGYFVDNELSWAGAGEENGRYGLAYGALLAPAGSHAKAAFVSQLKEKYGDVAKLNAAWKSDFADWSTLDAPVDLKTAPTPERSADMGAFVKALASRYFTVIRDELKRSDPDHLYLGCRFAWSSEDAVAAASEICDVVSFNIYEPRVDEKKWGQLAKLNKPCIIGEFHFGALDRGMFHPGLVSTPNQKARAAMYEDYLKSVLENDALVGCHWFQYTDEPITGRSYDGENYNIGFVDVTDTPYPEMVTAARNIHARAYTLRYGSGKTK